MTKIRDDHDKVVAYDYGFTDRVTIIRRILHLAEKSTSDAKIARALNDDGLRTITGKPWTSRSVGEIVRNGFYAGYLMQWGEGSSKGGKYRKFPAPKIIGEGAWPRLIEPERWHKIIAARADRDIAHGRHGPRRIGRPPTVFLVSGISYCARCGKPMGSRTSTYKRKDGTRKRSYVCPNVKPRLCDQPLIDAEAVDAAILTRLDADFAGLAEWYEALKRGHDDRRGALLNELQAAGERAAKLDRLLPRLRDAYLDALDADGDGRADHAAYEDSLRERDELRERIAQIDARLEALEDEVPADAMLDAYSRLAAALRGKDMESLAVANGRLRRFFDRFELESLTAPLRAATQGVEVRMALRGPAVVEIIGEPLNGADGALLATADPDRPSMPPMPSFLADLSKKVATPRSAGSGAARRSARRAPRPATRA